ncbi:cytochrome P450 76T24-like [Juglans microcarpa x Juglans regia]|uniref:cytochrome P450 76T24-like n=1 Tax=Juglans microcarpa x Juglans regia TaxID=2249226 RepID=UPI001B7E7B99|nr:cytochrome P450 76T24-like [Juglans microcarpa x Juglans regia]
METLAGKVVEASEAGEAINIGRLAFGTTLSLLSDTMFSVDLIDPKSTIIQELKEHAGTILELVGKPNVSDFFPLLETFDLQGIRQTLKDMFIGGTCATTTTVEWAMAEVLRNPGIMAKAKQELAKTIGLGRRTIQEKDILPLPYLQSVLKETMRLHPTAPLLLTHRALIDVQVCGYTIPEHTPVIVNA